VKSVAKKKHTKPSPTPIRVTGSEIARGLALFLGGFSLLNLVAALRYPAFDLNAWWIDFRPVAPVVAHGILAAAAAVMIIYALRPRPSFERRLLTLALLAALLIVTGRNIASFYILLARRQITAVFPVPFALFIALGLAGVVLGVIFAGRIPAAHARRHYAAIAATVGVCIVALPLAQMHCFGKIDERRPADAIVVFGARVYADGSLSDAFADRVRTACQLYSDRYARTIIVSGGPGDGGICEADAAKRVITQYGIPAEAVIADPNGRNTRRTAVNTTRLLPEIHAERVLAVSHFYHLPRVKMTYQRLGRTVHTVPAEESYPLTKMPLFILREIPALWLTYLQPLVP